MKRVLIIAPDFAPSSLPPATRVRFFAKHLPAFGWEPIVLTTDPHYYEQSVDPDNDFLIPDSLEVIRTRALPARWTRKIGIGDIGMRSLWHHWHALKRICKRQIIDLIFIPVPPYMPMLLGRLTHMRFRIPYVIDYIDPWVTEYYWRLPKAQRPPKWRAGLWLARNLEPFALKRVSHITGVSKGTTDSVIESYSWLTATDATEIPYGAEASDFDYVRAHQRQNHIFDRRDGLFHMSYVGACPSAMYETVRAAFQAVRMGLERAPDRFARLRLHFIGTSYAPRADGTPGVLSLAKEAGIETIVSEYPSRIPYLESLQVMIDSHALLLIGSDEAHYTASKVFPYIMAKRPLLAVLHEESSAVGVLDETKAGHPITFNSQLRADERIAEISARLEQILVSPIDRELDTQWDIFERYRTTAMTARLTQAFDNVLKRSLQGEQQIRASQTKARERTNESDRPIRVLVPFNTVTLYGMERSVIETFDLLRPEIEPHFLLSLTAQQMGLPLLAELERRNLEFSFLSDKKGWPKIGRPRSLKDAGRMTIAMIRGNLNVLKASRQKDTIYLPSVQYFYFAILAAVLFRFSGKRIIFQFHDLISRRSLALRLTALFVTDFVHNTETGRRIVLESNRYLAKKRNFVIPSAVEAQGTPGNNDDITRSFQTKRNIFFVGQVSQHKGIELLLNAFSSISKSRSDVSLHVVGGCDDIDLKQRLQVNGSSRVKYWGYRDDVLDLITRADLIVQPTPHSTNESFGRSAVEAMLAGKPVVCFRSGALEEIVLHEQTGLVCDDESAESLAWNVERLLNDDNLRVSCGQQARLVCQKLYSPARVRKLWLSLLLNR